MFERQKGLPKLCRATALQKLCAGGLPQDERAERGQDFPQTAMGRAALSPGINSSIERRRPRQPGTAKGQLPWKESPQQASEAPALYGLSPETIYEEKDCSNVSPIKFAD